MLGHPSFFEVMDVDAGDRERFAGWGGGFCLTGSDESRGNPRLPSGTVTRLMADVESSVRLWESNPDGIRRAMGRQFESVSAKNLHPCNSRKWGPFTRAAQAK